MALPRPKHHAMLAQSDRLRVAVDRDMPHGQKAHPRSYPSAHKNQAAEAPILTAQTFRRSTEPYPVTDVFVEELAKIDRLGLVARLTFTVVMPDCCNPTEG